MKVSRSPPDLAQCDSIDIEYPPFSRFLIGYQLVVGWHPPMEGGRVWSPSFPREPCDRGWVLVFWFSC